MKRTTLFFVAALVAMLTSSIGVASEGPPPVYAGNTMHEIGGRTLDDPYQWIEDPRHEARVGRISLAQNRYTQAFFSENILEWPGLTDRLNSFQGSAHRGVPSLVGGKYFFPSRDQGQQAIALMVGTSVDPKAARVLLDPNTFTGDDASATADWFWVSPDGEHVAVRVSRGNNDQARLDFIEVESAEIVDSIPEELWPCVYPGDHCAVWVDEKTIAYRRRVQPISEGENAKEFLAPFEHVLGQDWKNDRLLADLGESGTPLVFHATSDARWVLFNNLRIDGSIDIYVVDRLTGEQEIVAKGKDGCEHLGSLSDGTIYNVTKCDAPNLRIETSPIVQEDRRWKVVVPEGQFPIDATYTKVTSSGIFVHRIVNASSQISLHDLSGKHLGDLDVGIAKLQYAKVSGDGTKVLYEVKDFCTPGAIYEATVSQGSIPSELWRSDVSLGSEECQVRQVWFDSNGLRVPMFVVGRPGLSVDAPILMYGYGGFNYALLPGFNSEVAAWLEKGFYVSVNLPGGGEFGEVWHEAGMRDKKQQVFDAAADATRALHGMGYSRKPVIQGGSNGGLLAHVVVQQFSGLFAGGISSAPVIQMDRFHIDHTGNSKRWIPDYGDPEDPADLAFLEEYCPLHNIVSKETYSPTLTMFSQGDVRVEPWHGMKQCVTLQARAGNGHEHLCNVAVKEGHSGSGRVSPAVRASAMRLRFALWASTRTVH